MQTQREVPVMEVKMKLLGELEAVGFPRARAVRALHHSGNTSLDAAVNWLIDHENDADIDQMPLVAINLDIESPQPSDITEAIKIKEQELRDRVRIRKEEEEKKSERERKKERIRAGKAFLQAKRIAEENEQQRLLALRKAEKEEERRAREKVLQKLEVDKLERKRAHGLPLESRAVKPSGPIIQEKKSSLPVKSVQKDEPMRECLRSLKHTYKDDHARVKRAFQTLLIYVGNVARMPDEEKFRKIRLGNPHFQERVGSLKGGIEFLELCGFERSEGSDFLIFPRDKVEIEVLNSAGSLLGSAITNPFFGLFEKMRED
ncbi:Ubiquitin-associated (UBA)/TS-N domain-containing protein, putative isoform 1 [Theobroma cacao]|uniref:Ubiquitin-associated (UBA)/TS-N domain-containing protein, putative isoform 1 n=1 Tax=Theobroma cacao TaxID=3641 RepID=A0A061DMF7_THECC|nr:Ubiquitin-associated (UBA)/TS-N domain-containing protein, putative isoform 1 [Theobroma cacao]